MTDDHDWPYFLHGGPTHGKEVSWHRAPVGAIYRVAIPPKPDPIFTDQPRPLRPIAVPVYDYEVTGPGHMRYKP
jgi:hypothetical protein